MSAPTVNRDGEWLVYHARSGKVEEHPPEVARALLEAGSHVARPGGKPGEYTAPAVVWHLATSPQEYLDRYPDGPNAELARTVLGGG